MKVMRTLIGSTNLTSDSSGDATIDENLNVELRYED